MALEKTAIDTVAPTAPIPSMRETEKVVTPYAKAPKQTLTQVVSGQVNTNSTPAAEPVGKTEESVTLSPQMAALARKEQQSRQREQGLKSREAALDKERAELAELKALKEALDKGDYSTIKSKIPYDAYTKFLLDENTSTDPNVQALKALEEKVTNVEKAHQDDISKRFEAAVADRRTAVDTLVESNPDFASLKKGGKVLKDAVVQHILDTWEHDDTELTPEQAAKEVKEALRQKKAELDALFEEPAPAAEEKKNLPPLKSGIKTLTNQMTTGEIPRVKKPLALLPEGERYAEARRRVLERQAKG